MNDALEEFQGRSVESTTREAVHWLKFGCPGNKSSLNIPFEGAYVSGLLGQSQSLLAGSYNLFRGQTRLQGALFTLHMVSFSNCRCQRKTCHCQYCKESV